MHKFYDMIAKDYDQLVQNDVLNHTYPYSGYNDMQDIITNYIYDNKHIQKPKILDIGIGTAALYEKMLPNSFSLTGIDISKKMLDISALKFPNAILYNHDILKGLPEEISNEKYDYIIINYVIKHIDIELAVDLINKLSKNLSPFGKIFIGDVMFLEESRRRFYLNDHAEILSYNYYLHTYNDFVCKANELLALSFMEINSYTGILIVEKYYESSLHFEESLIKYKTNTVKWKSTQSKNKRE